MPRQTKIVKTQSVQDALKRNIFSPLSIHNELKSLLSAMSRHHNLVSSGHHFLQEILSAMDEMDTALDKAVRFAQRCNVEAGKSVNAPLLIGIFAETTVKGNLIISMGCPVAAELTEGQRWNIARGMTTRSSAQPEELFFIRSVDFPVASGPLLHEQKVVQDMFANNHRGRIIQAFISDVVTRLEERRVHICEQPYVFRDFKGKTCLLGGEWMLAARSLDVIGLERFSLQTFEENRANRAVLREFGLGREDVEDLALSWTWSYANTGRLVEELIEELRKEFLRLKGL